jgi:hypothetical protein
METSNAIEMILENKRLGKWTPQLREAFSSFQPICLQALLLNVTTLAQAVVLTKTIATLGAILLGEGQLVW